MHRAWFALAASILAELRFVHHFGDRQLEGRNLGQTDLADIDRDGDLDFIVGEQRGRIFWYEYQAADRWTRHDLGTDSPSDVGGAALDVNRDGWIDFVAGGAWYENPKSPRDRPFVRHVFDARLAAVHDLILGDVDGDGRTDVLTMSDQNDVRWYGFLTMGCKPGKPRTLVRPCIRAFPWATWMATAIRTSCGATFGSRIFPAASSGRCTR